jgi:hypothetical protein
VECVAGETERLRENLHQCHFVHHKSHMPDPGSNPGRRNGKPTTNRLRYSTATVVMFSGCISSLTPTRSFHLSSVTTQTALLLISMQNIWAVLLVYVVKDIPLPTPQVVSLVLQHLCETLHCAVRVPDYKSSAVYEIQYAYFTSNFKL